MKEDLKTEAGLYRSKIRASLKYDKENVDTIRVRVPKGWKEKMKNHVNNSDKYKSINGMVCDLIAKEIGIKDNKE